MRNFTSWSLDALPGRNRDSNFGTFSDLETFPMLGLRIKCIVIPKIDEMSNIEQVMTNSDVGMIHTDSYQI